MVFANFLCPATFNSCVISIVVDIDLRGKYNFPSLNNLFPSSMKHGCSCFSFNCFFGLSGHLCSGVFTIGPNNWSSVQYLISPTSCINGTSTSFSLAFSRTCGAHDNASPNTWVFSGFRVIGNNLELSSAYSHRAFLLQSLDLLKKGFNSWLFVITSNSDLFKHQENLFSIRINSRGFLSFSE